MPVTRRDILIRAEGGASALALRGVGSGSALEPAATTMPPGVVTLEDFEAFAKQRVAAQPFEVVRGGAAGEITVRWNREAFNRIQLRSRVLVGVSKIDTRGTRFGQALAS